MLLKTIYFTLIASLFLGCGSSKKLDHAEEARDKIVGSWDRVCVRDAEKHNSYRDLLSFDKEKSMLTVNRTTYIDLYCADNEIDHEKLEAIYRISYSNDDYKGNETFELYTVPICQDHLTQYSYFHNL